MILVNLFVRYEDLDKYERGEQIEATDGSGKSAIFKHHEKILSVGISSRDIIGREDVVTRGFVSGTFDKYLIQKM